MAVGCITVHRTGANLRHSSGYINRVPRHFHSWKPRTTVGRDPSEEETPKEPKREEHGSADNSKDRSYETLVPKNEDAFPEQRWNERLHYGRRDDGEHLCRDIEGQP